MNNEEKILSALESMQAGINDRFDELGNRMDTLENKITRLQVSQKQLEVGQKLIRKDIEELRFVINEGLWSEVVRLDGRIDGVEKRQGIL